MIIGIGGISRSGKTKFAKRLNTYFKKQNKPVTLLSADNFMLADEQLPHINSYLDREIPQAINFKKLMEHIKTVQKTPETANTIIIIEGHMIFAHPHLNKLFNRRFFFHIEKNTFVQRKMKDTRWGQLPPWYIEYSWQTWLQYGQINQHSPHLRLDGNRKLPFDWVLSYIYGDDKNIL